MEFHTPIHNLFFQYLPKKPVQEWWSKPECIGKKYLTFKEYDLKASVFVINKGPWKLRGFACQVTDHNLSPLLDKNYKKEQNSLIFKINSTKYKAHSHCKITNADIFCDNKQLKNLFKRS